MLHPPIICPVGKPESSRKYKAFQKKLGQSEFKIGTNYTIQLGNWKLFSKQKLRDNLRGYVTLKLRPSGRMIIDLVSWKF